MVLGVPNTLIHNNMPPTKDDEERLITKITRVIVDMILELDSETYRKHTCFDN